MPITFFGTKKQEIEENIDEKQETENNKQDSTVNNN